MLLNIIDEVNKALDNDLYISALSLVLTIPDICGKAEFPELEKQTKKRYTKWFDEHIGKYEEDTEIVGGLKCPHLSGEVVYSLRNSMLHQGTPSINKDDIKTEYNKIDRFILVKEPKNEFELYSDTSSYNPSGVGFRMDIKRTYHLSIRRLCFLICKAAEAYYDNNKEKFDFFNYRLVDEGHEYDDIF